MYASTSLALLVKDFDPQNTFHSLLTMMDVMVLWLLAVRSIGLARLSGASVGKAALWIFGIWIVITGVNDWIWGGDSGGVWRLTFLIPMRFDVESSETKSV